jgi:hypothetical protein
MVANDESGCAEGFPFRDLTPAQQDSARARFFDAGPSDGKVYALDRAGRILSRRPRTFISSAAKGEADGRE